jgi:amino acid adenylation domain-containing protein
VEAAIPTAPRGEPLPLSFAQERLWFVGRLAPTSTALSCPYFFRVRGELHEGPLARAIAALVRRHESLRTRYAEVAGRPTQSVVTDILCPLERVDLALRPDPEATLSRWIAVWIARPFDLSVGPPVRTCLLTLASEDHVVGINFHHIAIDGLSIEILFRELAHLYAAECDGSAPALAPLPLQYADYAVWQRGELANARVDAALRWWRRELADVPPLLELPTDRPRPSVQSFRGSSVRLSLAPAVTRRLRALGVHGGTTLSTVLLAAFVALVHRVAGAEQIVLGLPSDGRDRPELEGVVGFFVNMLPVRVDASGEESFAALLGRAHDALLAARAHALPFDRLVQELRPERSASHSPVVQVGFAPVPPAEHLLALRGLSVDCIEAPLTRAIFDLTMYSWEAEDGVEVSLEYAVDLFERATIERLGARLLRLVEAASAAPTTRVSGLPLLGEDERDLLERWSAGPILPSPVACVHDLLAARAARTPEAVALAGDGISLTYRELDRRANALAHRLRELGVTRDVVVGLYSGRGVELIVGAYAVLKAGGAFLPLDPAHPIDRIAWTLADAAAPVVLARPDLAGRLGARVVARIVDWFAHDAACDDPPVREAGPRDLAYVIYTSGSTGRPKAVVVEHRNVLALLAWGREVFSLEDLRGTLASTSVCFDISVFEIFQPLVMGGTILLADDALALPGLPARDRVTLINTVPSAIAELVRSGELPPGVRVVTLVGEKLSGELSRRVYRRSRIERLYNLYGPTETTVYSSWCVVPRELAGDPTIGRPLAGTSVYILDRERQPVPIGVAGELYIGGAGVSRGYFQRPELTAERFPHNPFAPGRMYRTGDLVRFRADGALEYLGRSTIRSSCAGSASSSARSRPSCASTRRSIRRPWSCARTGRATASSSGTSSRRRRVRAASGCTPSTWCAGVTCTTRHTGPRPRRTRTRTSRGGIAATPAGRSPPT